jgi:hypothetical protein
VYSIAWLLNAHAVLDFVCKEFVPFLTQQEYPLSYMEGDVPKGIVFDFVEILKDKYGFNYTVKMPQENIIGDEDRGIISMVYKKVSEEPQVINCRLE